MLSTLSTRRVRGAAVFILVLLVIEFMDEFVFGARETAMPLIRRDLNLSYEQIGLLLTLPAQFAGFIEIGLGILADIWKRRVLILGGGIAFALALFMMATSNSYLMILVASLLFYPASGAFVSLSQSTLMDLDPHRHEQNMARWTFAGSLGITGGALMIGLFSLIGLGWREFFALAAVLSAVLVAITWQFPFPKTTVEQDDEEETVDFRTGLRGAWQALKRREVMRWLLLLQASDLVLDVLHGYLALYFVDVVGMTPAEASIGVLVWTGVGLVGDFLLIPLLERVRGLVYLRISVIVELILLPLFLLVPDVHLKLIILGVIGLFNAGWYSILQGHLYSSMPGQSGTVLTLTNIGGFLGGMLPLIIGLIAGQFGLGVAMWVFILGPIALLLGLPRPTEANDIDLSLLE